MLYSRGDLNPADYISRHLQGETKCDLIAESAEQYVNFVMSQATPMALSREEISEATRKDATLQEAMRLISTVGQPEAVGGSWPKHSQDICQHP